MVKRAVEEAVGNGDKRKNVENGEKKDRMCQKCHDARRGNIEIFLYSARSFRRMYVVTNFVQVFY